MARGTDAVPVMESKTRKGATAATAARPRKLTGPWGASFDGKGTKGLTWPRRWTRPDVHPYDEIEWETRTANIGNESGKTVFEQKDVEVPRFWSQLATNVVVSKYFRGHVGTPEREHSVKQLIDRVVNTIAAWGETRRYFATDEDLNAFKAELTHLLVHQKMAFNSPVWFNVGIEEKPQCSACQPHRALVSTPDGMVPIGRLVEESAVGREVYDANGVTRVVAVKNNGFKPVYRVRLRNGNFVEATPDHVVRAVRQRRTQPEWLRVDELEVGMRMHLHPHRARVGAPALAAAAVGAAAGAVAAPSALGGELAEFVPVDEQTAVLRAEAALAGWLQADGFVGQYTTGTNRSLTIEFQVANDDEYRWVMENLDVALPHVHAKVRDAATKETRVQRIRIYGEVVRDFVERWGLLARGTDIRVPERLWTASTDEVSAYLRSIFQADGYVTVRRSSQQEAARIAFAVIGERWAEDVQILLNSIGIYSRRTRKHEKRDDRHDLHEVAISVGSERARFAELVGFVGRDKQARLLESLGLPSLKAVPNVREEEIVAIEDLGVEEVYDIQTESGEYLSNNVAVHNCFINSVEDNMSSIMDLAKTEAMLFKFGSGAGSNLSPIRSSKERMSGGGIASGPVSFMKGYDAFAGVIKSGGKTRRAAKMVILNADHPDILDFVDSKKLEEQKAWALIEQGYDPSFTGEAYASVYFQNANHSVRVTDDFMRAVESDGDWTTRSVVDDQPVETLKAREIFRRMADAAHLCGDPGIQYDTTINDWHTSANTDRIYASNPCSEYMFLNDTACNLASLNLMKFVREDGEFDVEAYQYAARLAITAQEILVDNASYPTPRIEENSHKFRPLGLGYANLGALLMSRGLAYDSDEGRNFAAALTAIMHGEAYRQSSIVARDHGGPFLMYDENRAPFLRVIAKHRDAAYEIPSEGVPDDVAAAARSVYDDTLELGTAHGFRNAQVTVLAPTGTIAFMMDCDTTGVEPDIALIKYKKLVGEGFIKIVNQTVPAALRKLGYAPEQVEEILAYVNDRETIEGAPHVRPEHLSVFDCAFKPVNGERSIHYMGHVRMMGAIQPFLSGAISKTVNMPEAATAEEIEQVYLEGWKRGLKAIAIYRDNSKRSQPLSTGKKKDGEAPAEVLETVENLRKQLASAQAEAAKPHRRRLPGERAAVTHKFEISGHEGYITVGLYPDGQPGEIFLKMAKEGSTVSGLMDSFATTVSVALQYGVPLRDLVNKFAHVRFEPSGFTGNQEIPIAKSIIDYIFRWLGSRFLSPDDKANLGLIDRSALVDAPPAAASTPQASAASLQTAVASPTPSPAVTEPAPKTDEPKAALAVEAPKAESAAEKQRPSADAATPSAGTSGLPASSPSGQAVSGELAVIASNGNGNGHGVKAANGGGSAVTLSLGTTNVSFKIQEDAPSCAECGSIMIRNGSCYKCLNCGSTSGCS
ncbi:MAG TPA: vitamin B12-dependent ribonucleotide reductase [Vitreimonas sp.]|nr:vitamin B12-dependent ribonucleotide reductase [Vitreimonas sp.]